MSNKPPTDPSLSTDKKPASKDDKSKAKKDGSKDGKKPDDKKDDHAEDAQLGRTKVPLPHTVVVHPLVLLSVVDHYTRVAKDTNRRVVGVLLGEQVHGQIELTNSFALPFEEDVKDTNIWYIDRQYLEDMFAMFKKVNARERIIGWYSTGPKIRASDIQITELFREYCQAPVLVVIDVNSREQTIEIPTEAYISVDIEPESQLVAASAAAQSQAVEQKTAETSSANATTKPTTDAASTLRKQFIHLPSKIEALEAEEVGVEHLLRGIRDVSTSTLSDQIRAKVDSLRGLKNRLEDMVKYLNLVTSQKIPVNHNILYKIQDILNLLPDIRVNREAVESLSVATNDNYMVMYLASLIRSITALADLIHNKWINKKLEQDQQVKEAEERKRRRDEQKKLEAGASKDSAATVEGSVTDDKAADAAAQRREQEEKSKHDKPAK